MNSQRKKKSGYENRQLARKKKTKENELLTYIPSLKNYFQVLPGRSSDLNRNEENEFVAQHIQEVEEEGGTQNLELSDTDHNVDQDMEAVEEKIYESLITNSSDYRDAAQWGTLTNMKINEILKTMAQISVHQKLVITHRIGMQLKLFL